MSDPRTAALAYAQENRQRFLEAMVEFSRIPSISTEPTAKADMLRAAEWVAAQLHESGMQHIQILPTAGHPVVYADYLSAGEGKPTALIYGHSTSGSARPSNLLSAVTTCMRVAFPI
jgi:acetylornithine deacetylase/succinyl-diaminopimelate desuccinylase-like protein